MLNGILVIDKEAGMTSADVIYRLRKILKIKKMGHAGTLDPDVTGVLPIAIGQATKLIELMHQQPKEYVGTGLLGYATDSYDRSGHVVAQKRLRQGISANEIQKAMDAFIGKITQVPPMYSAVKVKGKHLYEYARAGIKVERPQRQVEVYDYHLTGETSFNAEQGQETFPFKIRCGKGTYVRSLVNDLGQKLGEPAVMASLRRTASSGFKITQAVKLSAIADHPEQAANLLQPIDAFFKDQPHFDLDQARWQKVRNGAWIQLPIHAKKVALRYNDKVKAIYQKKGNLYCPALMLLANE